MFINFITIIKQIFLLVVSLDLMCALNHKK